MKHIYLTLAALLFAAALLFLPDAAFAAAQPTVETTGLLTQFGISPEVAGAISGLVAAIVALLAALGYTKVTAKSKTPEA